MKVLEITSYVGCINSCWYCPQKLLTSVYKGKRIMTLPEFELILDNVPRGARIDFTGMSEIFGHRDGAMFIRTAYDRGYRVLLYSTLQGISQSDFETLKDVKFEDVKYHQIPGCDLSDFNEKIRLFNEIQQGSIVTVSQENNSLWSRAGTVHERDILEGRFFCAGVNGKEFDHNLVLPNGDVYICCMDYGLKHGIGNLFETHYNNLDREKLRELSDQKQSEIICRKCELFKKIVDY